MWSSHTGWAEQSSGKCRAEASSGNGVLCAQGCNSPGLGDGTISGDTRSRLLWAQRHRRVRTQVTRTRGRAQVMELGALWRARHGSGGARALH